MSNTQSENQPATYQFQFQHPIQYPMSQAQVNYVQQPSNPVQATTSTTTTPQPTTSTASYQTASTSQTNTQGATSSVANTTASSSALPTSTQQTASSSSQTTLPHSRSAAEQARKDRTLADFMLMLDDHEPLIPNEVTDYYLQRVGFECEDVRLKRLLALAAQKFVSDIAADAFQHARIRTNATASGRGRAPLGQSSRDKTRTTLTMEDLSNALFEYGITARKPDFYM